jgi:hypothetical protein
MALSQIDSSPKLAGYNPAIHCTSPPPSPSSHIQVLFVIEVLSKEKETPLT